MFNLLKMDLHRLFRTRSFYAIFGIMAAFCAVMFFAIDAGGMMETSNQLLDLVHMFFSNSIVPMLLSIGVCIFVCSDYSSGYIKNIASGVKTKANIALSKFVTWIIATLIYFTLLILLIYIFGSVTIGNVVIGDMNALIQYVGMSLFLHIVVVALAILATCFLRSSAASITFTVVATQFVGLIYMAIDKFLNINLNPYSVLTNVSTLPIQYSEVWNKLLISGFAFLVIYIVAACVVMNKKDIT